MAAPWIASSSRLGVGATIATLKRRTRGVAGRLIRAWGLLPAGQPNGLADDALVVQWTSDDLPGFDVMAYFADPPTNLYQLRQWYGPLRRLHVRHRAVIVCMDSRTSALVRQESGLPALSIARSATLARLVSANGIGLALYVNHNVWNFDPLRFTTLCHAYLGHGESDKATSVSNQVKAYDYVLVAGQGGIDRLRRHLLHYDADRHAIAIGRPQLDVAGDDSRPRAPAARRTVLYAPTWEGAQPNMAYGSIASHGPALLRSLLAAGDRVIYRPHPRAGANDAAYAVADRALRALVQAAQEAEPAAQHRVDVGREWNARTAEGDVLITDISAVAADWLATARPLLITEPASRAAFVDTDNLLAAVPVISAADACHAHERVDRALADFDPEAHRARLEYMLGDTAPGASLKRFLEVCDQLIVNPGDLRADRTGSG
jgi:hypothetical protein